jgi:hypothetical protein
MRTCRSLLCMRDSGAEGTRLEVSLELELELPLVAVAVGASLRSEVAKLAFTAEDVSSDCTAACSAA